jgi:molybdopterin-guanine dinucleotide biosynthesis protein A
MGVDKSLLRLQPDSPTIIELVVKALRPVTGNRIVIVSNQPGKYDWLGLPVVTDNYPGCGPLAGLEAGLAAQNTGQSLLVACDMPFLNPGLLQALVEFSEEGRRRDALVPLNQAGLPEPLCALYNTRVLPVARELLGEGQYKMSSFLSSIITRYLLVDELRKYDPKMRSFVNLNTPEEYRQYQPLARSR